MKNIKVLMIDDNIKLIDMVKEYFSDHASIDLALEAHDGIEGIKLIKENQSDYDVVILDLIMPNKDGISVLEDMKELSIRWSNVVARLLHHTLSHLLCSIVCSPQPLKAGYNKTSQLYSLSHSFEH